MVAGHVSMDIASHDVNLPINAAIPCGLIVNELVSNALKHGFAGQGRGSIQVVLARDAAGTVELSISNDGTPIPPEQPLERSDSLGLQLVQMLTRQLHGQLTIQRSGPTRFTLRFRLDSPS